MDFIEFVWEMKRKKEGIWRENENKKRGRKGGRRAGKEDACSYLEDNYIGNPLLVGLWGWHNSSNYCTGSRGLLGTSLSSK